MSRAKQNFFCISRKLRRQTDSYNQGHFLAIHPPSCYSILPPRAAKTAGKVGQDLFNASTCCTVTGSSHKVAASMVSITMR